MGFQTSNMFVLESYCTRGVEHDHVCAIFADSEVMYVNFPIINDHGISADPY